MRCGHCQNYLNEPTSKAYCLTCGSYICASCISGDTSHLESSTDDSSVHFEQTQRLCSNACLGGNNALLDSIKSLDESEVERKTIFDQQRLDACETQNGLISQEELFVYTERVSEKIVHVRDTITVKSVQINEQLSPGGGNQISEQKKHSLPDKSAEENDVSKKQNSDKIPETSLDGDIKNQDGVVHIEPRTDTDLKPTAKITCDNFINITVPLQVPLEQLSSETGRNADMHLKIIKKESESKIDEELYHEQESGYGSQNLLQSSSEMLDKGIKDDIRGTDQNVESNGLNGDTESDSHDEETTTKNVQEIQPNLALNRGKSASVEPLTPVVLRRSRKVSPERRITRGLSRSNSLPDLLKSTEFEKRKSIFLGSNEKLSKSTVDLLEDRKRESIPFQMCDKNHKAPPAYICFKDNEIYCKVCVQMHNLHCHEKVKFIPEIPPEIRTKACDDSVRELLSAKERFNHVKDEVCADMQLLKDNRKEYVRAVMKFKQNMIKVIDEIEKQALADMDLIYNLELEKFRKSLAKLETSISELDNLLEELKVKESNEDNSIFYNIQSVSNLVTESELDLHGIHKSCFKTEFSFQPQDTILSLNNNSDMLWTIKLSKDVKCHAPYPCTCDRSYKYRKAEFDKQFSAKLSGWSFDRDKCYISGCEFLQNGNLLLADNHNKKVKMFDKRYRCVSALSLSSLPWDLAVLDKHLAVVSIPDKKQLQFFETKQKLSSKHSVFLKKNCWGVARANELLVVTCWSRDVSEILVMDRNGVTKRTIATANRTPFSVPWYVSVSNDVIRVSDWGSNKVTFIRLTGEFLGQYSDNTLMGTMGISSDPENNLYVCARDTNSIHQVAADGGKVQTILTERDGIEKPLCVCHCALDNRFVVTSWMSDTVQVFRLV